MAKNDMLAEDISFEERTQYAGLALSIVSFLAYGGIVLQRAATDGLPLTQVAWRGPMLLVVVIAGVLYGGGYLTARLRHRGIAEDDRDRQIRRYGEATTGGLTGLSVFVSIILLAVNVDPFWVVHTLFLGSGFATFVGTAAKVGAYREGIPS